MLLETILKSSCNLVKSFAIPSAAVVNGATLTKRFFGRTTVVCQTERGDEFPTRFGCVINRMSFETRGEPFLYRWFVDQFLALMSLRRRWTSAGAHDQRCHDEQHRGCRLAYD
jgi:hypothetical protein